MLSANPHNPEGREQGPNGGRCHAQRKRSISIRHAGTVINKQTPPVLYDSKWVWRTQGQNASRVRGWPSDPDRRRRAGGMGSGRDEACLHGLPHGSATLWLRKIWASGEVPTAAPAVIVTSLPSWEVVTKVMLHSTVSTVLDDICLNLSYGNASPSWPAAEPALQSKVVFLQRASTRIQNPKLVPFFPALLP